MRWRKRKFFANAFELWSGAAARVGPKTRRPRARKRSTTPAASGASGPTTVSWTFSRATKSASSPWSVMGTFSTPGSRAVPPFPGATNTFWPRGLGASFQAIACSRPPPPMTRSFIRGPPGASVPEVADAGEHHREPELVGRADHLVVAHTPARLDDGFRARLRDHVDAVAERKERVGGDRRAGQRESRALRLEEGDPRAVDAAHLPGHHPEDHAAAREHDGVRFHELRDAPGEEQVLDLRRRRGTPADDLEVGRGDVARVRRLDEHAAPDPLQVVALDLVPHRYREHSHVRSEEHT